MKTTPDDTVSSRGLAGLDRGSLAAAVEHAADGIEITDRHGTITYVNASFTAMTGYSSEEAIGRTPRILKSGHHSADFYRNLWGTILSGRVWQGELINRRRDGAIYHEESRISPVQDANGEIIGFVAVKRDISERKKGEESQALLAAVVENSADSIIASSPDGIIRAFNQGAEKIFGYSAAEVLGRHMSLCVPPDRAAALEALAGKLRRGERFSQYEGWCQHKDGHRFQVSVSGFPIANAAGQVIAIANILRDITERKRAEAALRQSEAYFRSMADSSPSMMWVTNAQGELEFINRMCRDFCGITCEEAQAGKWRTLLHPDDAPVYLAAFERAIREHTSFSAEARMRRADGAWRMIGSRGEPRFSPEGEYLGHIGLRADITERRIAEQERQFQHSLISAIYEGSIDGILVVDSEGRIASRNNRFFSVWQIPESKNPADSYPIGSPHEPLLSVAAEQLRDPEAFLAWVHRLYADPAAVDQCETELKDGGTLEHYSTGLANRQGQYLGRVWFLRDISVRKQTEQRLLESERRFRTMADGCPMPLWVADADGEIEFVNQAFRQFNTFDRVKGRNWQLLLHPDDASGFLKECMGALAEHRAFTEETRVRRSDGEWRWLAAFVSPRYSPNGEFLGHVGLGADITPRKQMEEALRASEEKFRELTENIREVFWLKEPGKSEFLYISPAYEQIWQQSCASFYLNPASRLELIHPDDLEESRRLFARQDQGEAVQTEYRIRTSDGQEKWIRSRAFPVHDQAGKLIRIAGIAEDVTEQKRYEAQLIRARAEVEAVNRQLAAQHAVLDRERKILRAFLDNVPDRMFVKDREGRFVIVNAEVVSKSGAKSPEEMIGKTDFDFSPPEIAKRFCADDQRVIRTGEPIFNREEKAGAHGENEPRFLLTTKVPLFDRDGRVSGLAGVARDITARRQNEDALRESNRRLQDATKRANHLAVEAEKANRAKSEFLANVSHEIRTPMNGVLGMTGLLLGSDLDQEQRHYAEVAHDSARSLLKVIDDILDFSRIEAGRLDIECIDFNLHGLIYDLADAMAGRVDENVEFVCAVAPDVCALLRGDPSRLRQVLMNLAGNAIKFTHRGEVVVHVDLISETETTASLRFSVRDTGIGIAAEQQGKLFTSFSQVDASTTRRYGGSGLGLAISKKLVELMGGEIGMKSREGEGSEFWFTLRLGRQVACSQPDSPRVPVKGARILVVDDNATNREVLTAQLKSWGAIVIAVESGSAALARLRDAAAAGNSFQAAVLDMMMPDMDGAALGAAILADEILRATPLVMMTSLGRRGDAVRLRDIGFAAYLVKPVRPSDLFDCLATVFSGGQQAEKRALITRHTLEEARRSNARILLVEDNLTNQEVASGILSSMGWHADVRANGREAIEALEAASYDLVLMDVQMPEMDGFEATRIIRDPQSRVRNHNVPVIATTAHAMRGDAERCLMAGMSDYISKPIDPSQLFKLVDKWLARKVHSPAGEGAVQPFRGCEVPSDQAPGGSLVFNREVFMRRMMEDQELAGEVAAGFVQGLPAMLKELQEQAALCAVEAVWKLAHKIKGSAANVGGEALRDVALQIELAARAGDLPAVVRQISDLGTQAARLSEELQQLAH